MNVRRHPTAGFSRTDVLVALAAIALLSALALIPMTRTRQAAHLAQCIANLQ